MTPLRQTRRGELCSSATVVKLTPAEAEVVAYAARGLTNREIAATLGKSSGTVKNQLARVYEKLGVRSRLHLITMFLE
jgi:DNA-binding CsgD family transcriptional regulator